jgi:ABC-type branched-subunit amino acid transport system substrate-binding protein
MKKQYLLLAVILAALAALAGLSVWSFCRSHEPKSQNLKIGAIVLLTGQGASLGPLLQNGMLTAESYINGTLATGAKPKVELIIEDSKNTVIGTIAAYNKLRAQGVDAIVSTGDIEFRALNGIVDDNPLPIIATCCTGGVENRSPWIFRYNYSERSQDRDLSEFLVNDLKDLHLTAVYPNNAYGQDILRNTREQFQAAGGTFDGSFAFTPESPDQKALAAKIVESAPRVLCIRGFGTGFVSIIKAVRELGFSGRIVGDVTISLPDTLNNVGGALEGSYHVASELDTKSEKPAIASYVAMYRKAYKMEPCFWDASGFDSVVFMWEAATTSGKSKEQVQKALESISLQNGLLGMNKFGPDGDLDFRTSIYQIKDGKSVLYRK